MHTNACGECEKAACWWSAGTALSAWGEDEAANARKALMAVVVGKAVKT